ncbi:MAG: glucose/arabinose dehydrogenase [Phycisphaerales bacterium]|jgi:glucose/arabinose dehydrogenase
MSIALCITTIVLLQSPYTTDYLTEPDGAVLEVGGMAFMADGDMVVSTRRGQVWRIDNPNSADPTDATFTLICEGLHEGLGLTIIDDEIFVMQRGEVSKLVDLDGDDIIDEVQTVTQDWGMSGNYHEFGFGLPSDSEGNMYISLNVGFWNPHWWHGKSRAPYRGWVLRVAPDGTVTPIAGGLRSPAGMGFLEDGRLLVTDNQGDWMAVCPVYAIEEGAYYGHPASSRWYEGQVNIEPSDTLPIKRVREHPALWLPYQWSRSTGNVIQDKTGGPFDGQYFIAELTNGQVLRAEFEEIDGVLQGACWQAHQRIGSAYHIEFGPDGTLYAGMTNRGWGGLAPGSGVARVKFNGETPLDMKTTHLLEDGFEITFTKALSKAPTVSGQKYDYNYWWEYGSPQQHIEDLAISKVLLSEDGLTATITIENLEAGKCVMLMLGNATATDGSVLLNDQVSYTINKMPGGELVYVAKEVAPPIERGEQVEGWLYLTWLDAFDMWSNDGVALCNAELDIEDPTQFKISEGMGALVATEGESMETTFAAKAGKIKFVYMLSQDSETNIQLPNGMTFTLADTELDGYLGPGIWHNAFISYNNKGIQKVEINGVNAVTNIPMEATSEPMPIRFKSIKGAIAFGDVRVQQTQQTDVPHSWSTFKLDDQSIKQNGDVHWSKSDSGGLIVWGTGSITVKKTSSFTSIRFDAKFNGEGNASITIGDTTFDFATQGERLTGSTNDRAIHANLIDQNEWCTVELTEGSLVPVRLNGVNLYKADTIELQGNAIKIQVDNAKVEIRRAFIQ